jgi:hypothetical protein
MYSGEDDVGDAWPGIFLSGVDITNIITHNNYLHRFLVS